MTDFSIKKTTNAVPLEVTKTNCKEYDNLKKSYIKLAANISKSDFANAPVSKQNQLALLAKLKEIAKQHGLEEEIAWIEQTEAELAPQKDAQIKDEIPIYPFGSSLYPLPKEPLSISRVIDATVNETGKVDEATNDLISILKDANREDEYFIPFIIKQCRNGEGIITPDKIKGIEILAKAGVEVPFIDHFYRALLVKDNPEKPIDIELCQRIAKAKDIGFGDEQALTLAKLLAEGYANEDLVIKSAAKLSSVDVAAPAVIEITKELTVENTKGQKIINPRAVSVLASIKSNLMNTRNCEKAEYESPINIANLPMEIYNDGKSIIYLKRDGSIQEIRNSSVKNPVQAKKEYEKSLAKTEDNLLLDITRLYKTTDGSLDTNACRALTSLRSFGVTNQHLIDLTDFCLDERGNIDRAKLSLAGQLKTAGALSSDIIPIINSIPKNSQGEYDNESINAANNLTKAVIGEPEISKLLPDAVDEEVLDFLIQASDLLDNKQNLVTLIGLTKSDGETVDSIALEIIDDILFSENNDKTETEFIKYIQDVLKIARGNQETANPAAEKVCCLIDKFTPEQVKILLKCCVDSTGNVNEDLADITYKLYQAGDDFNSIAFNVRGCQNNGEIDYENIQALIESIG